MDVDEAQQLGALTVDDAGSLLPGCSEQRCLGDHMPSLAEPEALAACLEWCKRHGAVLDQETGEEEGRGVPKSAVRAGWLAEGAVCST